MQMSERDFLRMPRVSFSLLLALFQSYHEGGAFDVTSKNHEATPPTHDLIYTDAVGLLVLDRLSGKMVLFTIVMSERPRLPSVLFVRSVKLRTLVPCQCAYTI